MTKRACSMSHDDNKSIIQLFQENEIHYILNTPNFVVFGSQPLRRATARE